LAIIGIAERRGVLSAAARRDNGYREYTTMTSANCA
jgi:hypothetical protein